jgi:hypothetical protein
MQPNKFLLLCSSSFKSKHKKKQRKEKMNEKTTIELEKWKKMNEGKNDE